MSALFSESQESAKVGFGILPGKTRGKRSMPRRGPPSLSISAAGGFVSHVMDVAQPLKASSFPDRMMERPEAFGDTERSSPALLQMRENGRGERI